jgi:AsmA protein
MSKGKKTALIVVIVLVVLVVGLAIAIPRILDIDRYRPQVAAQLELETGKPVQIGHLDLTILPRLAIRVDGFYLGNPAGFPTGDCVQAKKIYAILNPAALLHQSVEITSLELDDLTLDLLEDAQGKWNFENPPVQAQNTLPPRPQPPGESDPSFTLGVISKLTVVRGHFSASSLLTLGVPGPAFVEVHGASVDLRQVDLNALATASAGGPAFAPSELGAGGGWLNTLAYAGDLTGPEVARGTVKADALRFGNVAATKLKSNVRLYPKQVFVDDLDMKIYGGDVTGNLSLNFGGVHLAYSVDAQLKGINVAGFLTAFPQAKGMMTGTLNGEANLQGQILNSSDPLAGITGTGQASIRNGKMPILQLGSNLRALVQIAKVGPASGDPSSFSSLSTNFRIADARLSNNPISLIGNGWNVDGSGSLTMAGAGTLDYQGNASLAAGNTNPLASVLGGLVGAKFANGRMTFPFAIGGTFARPKFSLKGGVTGQNASAPANTQGDVVRGLAGLLKKKKQ